MVSIFYDSTITGHHSEYISHIVKYIGMRHDRRYIFILPEEFCQKFNHIIDENECDTIQWVFIPDRVIKKLKGLPHWRRSFAEYTLVCKYVKQFNAEEVFLLHFDVFQLALIFNRATFKISGILFIQLYRLRRVTVPERLRFIKKYLYTKLYVLNKSIRRVFILNDTEGVCYLNREFRTSIFKMLVDPIPEFVPKPSFNTFTRYGISVDRKILLHPGSIHPRKGTFEIVEAVNLLNKAERGKYVVLIVGRSSERLNAEIQFKIEELTNKETPVIYDNSYISDEQLAAVFRDSFAVLIPYKNVASSSGILGHAALYRLPVLAPDVGLIGNMVSTNSLGVLIKEVSPSNIAMGIEQLEGFEVQEDKYVDFCTSRTIQAFANTILQD